MCCEVSRREEDRNLMQTLGLDETKEQLVIGNSNRVNGNALMDYKHIIL